MGLRIIFHLFPEPLSVEFVSLFDIVMQPFIIAEYCIDFVRVIPLPAKDPST